MLKKVENKKDLKRFIYFVKDLYRNEDHYIFPIFRLQYIELKALVLKEKTYKALLHFENDKVTGRLLYTLTNDHDDHPICYFSLFDAVNDQKVAERLFDAMETDMKNNDVIRCEGTFAPYDPDTRRGILIKGFDEDPTLHNSYNHPYYQDLLESQGYEKGYDTYAVEAKINARTEKKLHTIYTYYMRRHKTTSIDAIDLKHLEREINDVHTVVKEASAEVNYVREPSIDLIREVARSYKPFINPDFILIAREKDTNRPIGFCLVLPDFNQLFKKSKGHFRPLKWFLSKHKIDGARGFMQYVVPEYQNTGLIGAMFSVIYDQFKKYGIIHFEAGTMLESNKKSWKTFEKFGGEIAKKYRIFRKDVDVL